MRNLLLFILTFFSVSLQSASPSVEWGTFIKESRKSQGKEINVVNKGRVFVMDSQDDKSTVWKTRDNKFFLSVFDGESLTRVSEIQLTVPSNITAKHSTYYFEDLFVSADQVYALFEAYDKKTKASTLYAQKITQDGKQVGKGVELGSLTTGGGYFFDGVVNGTFTPILSNDFTKFGLVLNHKGDVNTSQKIQGRVFGKDLKELANKTATLPHPMSLMDVQETYLTNDNKLVMNTIVYHPRGAEGDDRFKKMKSKKGVINFYYEILIFDLNTGDLKQVKLEVAPKKIAQVGIKVSNDGKVIKVAGSYTRMTKGFEVYFNSSKSGLSKSEGWFIATINVGSGKMSTVKSGVYSNEVLKEIKSKKQMKKIMAGSAKQKTKEIRNFELRDFVVKDDGSSVMILEYRHQYTETQSRTDSRGFTVQTYVWHSKYNELIVLSFDADNNLQWQTMVFKRQHARRSIKQFEILYGMGYNHSYFLTVDNDHVSIMFTDATKNLKNLKKGKKLTSGVGAGGGIGVVVQIDNKGKQVRTALYTIAEKKQRLNFRPKGSWYPRNPTVKEPIYVVGIRTATIKKQQFKIGKLTW
ncbi:MAG: hypothetical protein ACJA0Q_001609 [Saprospiraceae bacterium]|jgi:hypothetical protein